MLRNLIARMRGLTRRRDFAAETAEEVQFHVEMETQTNLARGLSEPEARRAALRDLGGAAQTREAVGIVRRGATGALWQDFRYSLRGLARSPGYVTTTVLGLGIGLTAAIVMFSALHTHFEGEPVGVEDRDSLARLRIRWIDPRGGATLIGLDEFQLLRGRSPAILDMGAMSVTKLTMRRAGEADSVLGAFVSDTFFSMLGTRPVTGRLLTPSDDQPGAAVVVLGYRTWQRWFGVSRDALGQVVSIGGHSMSVVGVLPDRFTGRGNWVSEGRDDVPQVWLPLTAARDLATGPPASALMVSARLAPGIDRHRARSDLTAMALALAPPDPVGRRLEIRALDFVRGESADSPLDVAGLVVAMMGVPTLLLLLGCANVANLRLARATARMPELSLRMALGASRTQVTRLLLMEAALLAGLALLVSAIGTRLLLWQLESSLLAIPVRIAPGIVAFLAAVALALIVLTGLAPAWLVTRRATATGLKQGARANDGTHARLRHTLVVTQVAISVLLLSLGMLLVRSLHARQELAFDPGPVVGADLDLESQGYDRARSSIFAAILLSTLQADARFANVGLSAFPFHRGQYASVRVEGIPRSLPVSMNRVTPGWFPALTLAPTAGRVFGDSDGPEVVVVSESVAQRIAQARNPLGTSVTLSGRDKDPIIAAIIGVVPDVWSGGSRDPTAGQVYLPLQGEMPLTFTLHARSAGSDPVALLPEINRMIAGLAPTMPWTKVQTAAMLLDEQTRDSRILATAMSSVGALATLLSAAGLFAVMSYTVSLRTREIGIRMALGGRSTDVMWLVAARAARLTALGAAIGLAMAMPLAFLFQSALFGLSPLDPGALLGTIGVLFLTALAASIVPALRAAGTSPLVALRAE